MQKLIAIIILQMDEIFQKIDGQISEHEKVARQHLELAQKNWRLNNYHKRDLDRYYD